MSPRLFHDVKKKEEEDECEEKKNWKNFFRTLKTIFSSVKINEL